MSKRVTPMIHVPDVRAAIDWYKRLGFTLRAANEEDGELNWAAMCYGNDEIMFSPGGQPSAAHRREFDLYILTEDVDEIFRKLDKDVDVVEGLHDTEYGMKEFIIRDLNRFWITFGEPNR